MEKRKLDKILESHVKWLNEEGGKRANLRGADLFEADLRGADLREANLRGADLHEANLGSADLRGADLEGADLRGADLREANLREADLRGAILYGANLRGANLRGAKLEEASLEGAILPSGIYQIVGAGSCSRCTTYDSINDQVICGCWNDGAGNHLDSFARRIEQIYGVDGIEPNLKYYKEYMSAVAFFKAMKEFRI